MLLITLIILPLLGPYQALALNLHGVGGGGYRGVADPDQYSPGTDQELQEAPSYPGVPGEPGGRRRRRRRRPRSVLGLPPAITIAGERPECRECELEGSLCLLFGLGKNEVPTL